VTDDESVRYEYAIRVDVPHPLRHEQRAGDVITGIAPATVRRCHEIWHGWTPVRRRVTPYEEWAPTGSEEADRG
jgi:hypothetical protein